MKLKRNTLNLITAIIFGSSTLMLTSSVNAQKPPEQEPARVNHEQIVNQLNLDETTQQSLLQLMNAHRAQHDSQRYEDHKNNRTMREQHRNDVKELLGDEKFEAFEKAMWQQRQDHRSKPKNRN